MHRQMLVPSITRLDRGWAQRIAVAAIVIVARLPGLGFANQISPPSTPDLLNVTYGNANP
jgi:hypothetical protein